MRRSGGEVELTQALAAVFAGEPEMAGQFVKILMRHAPRQLVIDDGMDFPNGMTCYAERRLEQGRADLVFLGKGGWHVCVELKIHATYGANQISRYLDSVPVGDRSLVVAITRTVPSSGDRHEDPRWLGSVQWAKILADLRRLAPANETLRRQWPLFLDVLESEGSMGFTRPNPQLFQAWGATVTARSHAEEFVDAVRIPIRDGVASLLIERGFANDPVKACGFETRGKAKKHSVFPQLGKMLFRLRIPADGSTRIQAGLWGYGDPRFVVETPYPRVFDATSGSAVDGLIRGGFRSWRDQHLEHFLRLDDALLNSETLQEEVIRFAEASIAAIVDSGVLMLPGQDFRNDVPQI